jgi:type II secretion system protein H
VWKVKERKSETGNENSSLRRERGFSLLELILVMVVMSLVMAIAYPSMSRGRTAFHLRAVARDVINSLRVARETAVTEQKVMMVLIDAEARQVTVATDVGEDARSYHPPDDVKVTGITSEGEELLQGPMSIRFLPNGSSDNALILVKADTGANLKIVLDPIIGSARIQTSEEAKTP